VTRSRHTILEELARENARVAELARAQDEARAKIQLLHSELTEASSTELPTLGAVDHPRTAADKVNLFRSLFRGRRDVFPVRFVSKRTGRPGYAPACSNKWEPAVCLLRNGGKCSDCANQAFIPLSDHVIIDHLQGRHVVGVYPLLEDETCWFLAVDFDRNLWMQDVAAFVETCREVGVPVAIERSRSGTGAHAWFFFTAPISASVARRLGCYLITATMSRRHTLSMDSYDRLFANQDTMPRGGFGNLIALPLQYEARQHSNSVFVDERFVAFPDQWHFLAHVGRIEPRTADAIAGEATRRGQVIGVRFADLSDDEGGSTPWIRAPSGPVVTSRITDPVPNTVKAILAQRLFVEKAGLPGSVLNQLKRLAAFQNPEFYQKQRMRLSTAMTPRVITCAEELPEHISLPRGCVTEAEKLLDQLGATLTVEDKRHGGVPIELSFRGELTPVQREAADDLLHYDTGVFVGPPGVGKTVLGTYLVARRRCSTLILVHRKPLLEQWVAQLAIFLGIEERSVGTIGGGKRKPNGQLDVAMIQSLVRRKRVDDVVATYGQVIIDECHHVPAISFERVLSEVRARFVVGLTATPQRRDGHQAITEMQIGPVRRRVGAKDAAGRLSVAHRLVVRETGFIPDGDPRNAGIQEIYRQLARDKARNTHIINDVIAAIEEGRAPILLTERKGHLDYLADHLRGFVRHVVVLKGGMTPSEERCSAQQLASIPHGAERLVIATGRYIGEGFDDARLDTLFLALPVSWKGTLSQYAGRLHRHHEGKREVRIYDYVDREVPMLMRMFEKRLVTYRAIGYARDGAPLKFEEPREERTVEYDADALRNARGPEEVAGLE
jgi:superfamily II DNA or RNA helicase